MATEIAARVTSRSTVEFMSIVHAKFFGVSKGQSLTLGLTDKTVTLAFDHGRTWTATMGKRQLGKVFKRDSCWGNKHIYICRGI
jgi:hypothetical protein